MTEQTKSRRPPPPSASVESIASKATPSPEPVASAHPQTVRETVELLDERWRRFLGAARAFPSERMDEPIDGGWTRKQMLAHIGAWQDLTHERLGKFMATRAPVPLTEDEDVLNARVARQAVGRTAGEVVKDMELSFNKLRRQIARMTDDQIIADDSWAAQVIAGNTYEHYEQHAADVYQPPSADARRGRR